MAEQPRQGQRGAAPTPAPPANAPATGGKRQTCPNCGAAVSSSASVCRECGEDLERRPRSIRCRACGQSASSALVICPHCGRELHPAPPRLLTWGGPALLALLFFFLLANYLQNVNPLARLDAATDRVGSMLETVNAGIDAEEAVAGSPETTASGETGEAALAIASADNGADSSGVSASEPISGAISLPTSTPVMEEPTVEPAVEPTQEPTEEPTATPTSEPTATATELPTETPTTIPTATDEPTAPSEPTATSTASATATATDEPSATNTPAATPSRRATNTPAPQASQRSGQAVSIALPTATPTRRSPTVAPPTPTPTTVAATGGTGGAVATIYIVQAGDTLLGIAREFNTSAQIIMDANDISPADAYTIRPGDELIIPNDDGAAAAPTATSRPAATSAPTTAPTVTGPTVRLDTPLLRSPENNTTMSCNAVNSLAWEMVPYILATDRYILHLGFVSARDATGGETVTWVLQQPILPTRSSWEMDSELCALAPQDLGRRWRWYVEVVDESATSVSAPSDIWGFTWN